MDGMRLIHSGDEWDHVRPPCSKDMTVFLEHNEKIVSWVQPLCGGVDDQIPVVRFNGAYYRLSLRMMKSVWRHIRLKKGFVNREAAPYGGVKLRIPQLLFLEKKRTQARFNVSRAASECVPKCASLLKESGPQVMRMDSSGPTAKDRKQVQNASNKISCVVHRVLLPLLSAEIPQFVSFRAVSVARSLAPPRVSLCAPPQVDSSNRWHELLEHLRADEPSSVKDRASFVERMGSLYDASFPRGVPVPALPVRSEPATPADTAGTP